MEYVLNSDKLEEVASFRRKADAIKKAQYIVSIEIRPKGVERPMYLNPDYGNLWGGHDHLATAIRLLKKV